MKEGFQVAFESWFKACQALINKHFADNYPNNPVPTLGVQIGQKRIRVTSDGSAWAFVDLETGDVLKPASFHVPAKHARGNIFDSKKGMGWMQWTGPAYLR